MQDDVSRMSKKELEREVRDLREKVRQLEGKSINQALWTDFNTTGAQAGVEAVIKQASETIQILTTQRDEAEQEALAHRHFVQRYMPGETLFNIVLEEGQIGVGISVIFRYGNAATELEAFLGGFNKVFHGTLEAAKNEVLPQVILAAGRVPIPADIGAREIAGVSRPEIMQILHDLAPYWYTDRAKYHEKRKEVFYSVLPQMMATGTYGPDGEKEAARNHFNNTIDNCFQQADKRHLATDKLLNTGEKVHTDFIFGDGSEDVI